MQLFLITTQKRNLGHFRNFLPLTVNVSYCHWKYSKSRNFNFFCIYRQVNNKKIFLVKIVMKSFIKKKPNISLIFFFYGNMLLLIFMKNQDFYTKVFPQNICFKKNHGFLYCKKSRGEEGSFNVHTNNFKPNKLKETVWDKRKLWNLVSPAVPVRFLATCFCWIKISRKLDQIQHSGAQVG